MLLLQCKFSFENDRTTRKFRMYEYKESFIEFRIGFGILQHGIENFLVFLPH